MLRRPARNMEFRQLLAVDARAARRSIRARRRWEPGPKREARTSPAAATCSPRPTSRKRWWTPSCVSRGHLGDRLIVAMRAGLAAGGEDGPIHSAGLKLVRDVPWPVADLRVDWTEDCPIDASRRLWQLYKPQLEAYVTRALDPAAAPSYGVPGDL